MKNIFGINVTENKENTEFDGDIFVTRRLSEGTQSKLDSIVNDVEIYEKKANLPLFLQIINLICWFLGIVIGLAILDNGIKTAAQNAPYFIYICVIAWITVIFLAITRRKKAKEVGGSSEFEQHIRNTEEIVKEAMTELEIPENCRSIDVIAVKYKVKNGKTKVVNFNPMFKDFNYDMFIFIKGNYLCLAGISSVYEIPVSSLRSIEPCSKKAMFPQWNKEEEYNSPTYKPYKVVENSQGTYYAHCFKVVISDISGDFELIIPNYDQPVFSEITGLNLMI